MILEKEDLLNKANYKKRDRLFLVIKPTIPKKSGEDIVSKVKREYIELLRIIK